MTTVRTIKLKRPTAAAQDMDVPAPQPAVQAPAEANVAPDAGEAASAPEAAAPVAAAPVAQPAAGTAVSAKSYLPYALAAAVVVVLFLVMMGLQYSEMSFYESEPSVWVKK